MQQAKFFWQDLFLVQPSKNSKNWVEFNIDGVRLGLLLNDFGDNFSGSNMVPVFELADETYRALKEKIKQQKIAVVIEEENHPDKQSMVLNDPFGNEFEITRRHD